jgi:hypothetical protein
MEGRRSDELRERTSGGSEGGGCGATPALGGAQDARRVVLFSKGREGGRTDRVVSSLGVNVVDDGREDPVALVQHQPF